MKVILSLFCILSAYEVFAQGDAPPFTQGQKQTTPSVATRVRVPNNQSTKLSSSQALIETGNRNLLANPGFEHQSFATGWTVSGSAVTSEETSAPLNGNKSFKAVMAANAVQVYQDSTLYAGVLAGTQGVIRFSASNTAPGATCYQRAAGVKLTGANNQVVLTTDGLKRNYEIPVVLSATSNGIECDTGTTAGTLILDDFEISDSLSLPEVAQPVQAVSAYFAGTTNCLWTRASTTIGAFSTDADCPGPTIESFSVGTWATTDVDLPRLTGTSLPAGKYIFTVTTPVAGSTTNANSLTINDGTSNCVGVGLGGTVTASTLATFKCEFNYTSPQASKPFELYGSATTGSVNISNDSASGAIRPTKIQIQYEPPASKIYSQPNNLGSEISFTGSGSWVTNTTYTKATYKFLPDGWVEYQYAWATSGAPTAATLSLNLPNGHTIDTARLAQGNTFQHLVSSGVLNDSSTNFYQIRAAFIASALTSVAIYPFGAAATYATSNVRVDQAVPFTWASGDVGHVTFRLPITTWQGSQITGTFREVPTTPGYSNPVTYKTLNGGSAATLSVPTVCAASPCVEVEDINSKWSACTRSGAGVYQCIAANGTWASSVSVECECESFSATSGQVSDCSPYNNGNQTWQTNSSGGLIIGINTTTKAGVSTDSYFSLWCRANGP